MFCFLFFCILSSIIYERNSSIENVFENHCNYLKPTPGKEAGHPWEGDLSLHRRLSALAKLRLAICSQALCLEFMEVTARWTRTPLSASDQSHQVFIP